MERISLTNSTWDPVTLSLGASIFTQNGFGWFVPQLKTEIYKEFV
jgi:hypothetical protein